MALFGIKTRNPARDRENDFKRFHLLLQTMVDVSSQLEAEAKGLEDRYRRNEDNAAFSQLAVENGTSELSDNVSKLSHSIAHTKQRLANIRHQIGFVQQLRLQVDQYLANT